MAYHKVYMNQIFSTSLTGQLAFMWRKELLCDAVIKAGNFSTKAHRLVMIAACPMLQHMENASLGSHLEVRLSSDISVTSIKMFLQYLYEGFMKLTEENYKEIEKISKVLQVDSITKCCIDFAKCLRQQSDQHYPDVNEFGIQEQAEFKFVKATDLEKTFSSADNTGDFGSSNKRPRVQSGRRESTGLDYPSRNYQEDRRAGFGSSSQNQQSTHSEPIEILDDGVEVINSEPAQRDEEGWPVPSSQPPLQHSMGVGVSTQSGTQPDVRVISISDHDVSIPVSTPPISQTSQPQETPQHTGFTSHASTKVTEQLGTIQPMTGIDVPVQQRVSQSSPFTTSTQCQLVPVPANQRKPFAAGNESQLNVSKDVDPSVYTGKNVLLIMKVLNLYFSSTRVNI
ncbi:hypothetical protein FSP39_008477 [Pinctada imbricata]|uniref:BTB domain-containing protein n=1 Tax=Pinctada imbricata TaxID=66713 RepID=A0AA89CA79_PINIB|nr:hypothetical protein FSP39_008477 [Pinctada imbricata]